MIHRMNIILYITVAQAAFSILLIATKQPNQISDKILCLLIAIIASPIAAELLSNGLVEYDNIISVFCFCSPFLFGPFLYLYTKVLISEKQVVLWTHWPHIIPFLILFLIYIVFPEHYNPPFGDLPPYEMLFFNIFDQKAKMASWIAYSVYSLYLIEKHRRNILNVFSYQSETITLKWLKYVNICFVVSLLCSVLLQYLLFPNSDFRISYPYFKPVMLDMLSFVFIIYMLSYFGLRQSMIFNVDQSVHAPTAPEPDRKEIGDPAADTSSKKYQRSGLSDELSQEYLSRLMSYMEAEAPYLKGDLTIEKLAKSIGILKHYLTQVLSQKLNKNFYTFVNEYRVEKAKQMMLDPEGKEKKLIDIAYESGFNSYSSFNNTFKKMTQISPSQFRKSHSEL